MANVDLVTSTSLNLVLICSGAVTVPAHFPALCLTLPATILPPRRNHLSAQHADEAEEGDDDRYPQRHLRGRHDRNLAVTGEHCVGAARECKSLYCRDCDRVVPASAVKVEVGAGEKPHPDYDVHVDILPLPDIEVISWIDPLPFATASVDALRANHVLEHQSYELVEPTLREWARVMRPGARLDIGVPDARFVAAQWVRGEIDTAEANYWILGGHSDRAAHQGVDARGVPRWIWNAHHTMFDAESLGALVSRCGFVDLDIFTYDIRNLRCYALRAP